MAKSKSNFLLEKGEKLILGVGVAGFLLFAAWGVMSLTAAEDPGSTISKFKSNAQRVQTAVGSETGSADPLPEWVVRQADFPTVPVNQFALLGPPFEPIHQPDMLRENPQVLGIYDAQIDVIRAPMRSLDLEYSTKANGDVDVLIGVLVESQTSEKDKATIKRGVQSTVRDLRNNILGRKAPPKKAPPKKAAPKAPFGMPGGPGEEGMAMGMEDGYGGMAMQAQSGQRNDPTVRYLPPAEVEDQGLPLAESVYPLRAVLVQAAFPMKAQLEEIKRALRLQNIDQARSEAQRGQWQTGGPGGGGRFRGPGGPGEEEGMDDGSGMFNSLYRSIGPVFDGFEVERRVITPSGEDLGWAPYDHLEEYFTKIRSRKISDEPDNPYLMPFIRYDQKLAAPLPELADKLGQYPPIRIKSIVDEIRKLQEANTPVPTQSEWQKRFQNSYGDSNPFAPIGRGAVRGLAGSEGEMGSMGPGPMGPRGPGGFGPGRRPGGRGGEEDAGGGMQASKLPEMENLLLRFVDPDITPGYTYQYRVRVMMKNPNFGRTKEVRVPSDAKKEILEGRWVTIPQTVTVPEEFFMYAYDSEDYLKKAEGVYEEAGRQYIVKQLMEHPEVSKGSRAVVQVHQWMPQVRAGNAVEPVGTWVITELPVAIGEYIGKRQLVRLPLWSAGAQNYVLRELTGSDKIFRVPEKDQPKGWPVNFRTRSLVVDFEGGTRVERFGNTEIRDQSASEILILRPDGKLSLKNSATDMQQADREKRNSVWDEWLTRVKERKSTPAGGPGEEDGRPLFERGS